MRVVPLVVAIVFFSTAVFASEIREFNIPTLERLGRELTQASQRPDRGATDAVRKQAVQTAKAAVQGKLFNIHYDYVVLNDPDGSGFLVYAVGSTKRPDEIVLAGHCRVTVSADGTKAERVDALSKSLFISGKKRVPPGAALAGMFITQLVSATPVETLIYTNRVTGYPIIVATIPDGRIWEIENGKMKDTGRSAAKK